MRSHSRFQRAYAIGSLSWSGGLPHSSLVAPAAAPKQHAHSSIKSKTPPKTAPGMSTATSVELLELDGSATGASGEGGARGGAGGGAGGEAGGLGGGDGGDGGGEGIGEGGGGAGGEGAQHLVAWLPVSISKYRGPLTSHLVLPQVVAQSGHGHVSPTGMHEPPVDAQQ